MFEVLLTVRGSDSNKVLKYIAETMCFISFN